ncbi:helix-turn-helix domain-containing protein [Pseudomonas urmiensis]|uniref:helix-turn-helix domain-containing protein n=1 Tax=Pseudomonas urmiensis TaxID=2745493 RepID=UPI003D11D0EF
MLRQAFASALKFMRLRRQVFQTDFEGGVSQSHVSRLERSESSVTLQRLDEIAGLLKIHPLTLIALTYGASEKMPPAELLELVRTELEAVDALDQPLSIDDQTAPHPRVIEAGRLRDEVQRLKSLGHSKAETSRMLGISKSTAARHW